jgi:hypothetical protein
VPSAQRVDQTPAMYTSYFRPDPAHPSQIVGVAWMDQALVVTHLIAGTREPGGTDWLHHAQVPPDMRPTLRRRGKLTLCGLAAAMVAAGVVRGMELDIHSGMVTFNTFHPDAGAAFGVAGAKLLPDMPQPSTRYLNPDQRDFLAMTLRSPTDPGAAPGSMRAPS